MYRLFFTSFVLSSILLSIQTHANSDLGLNRNQITIGPECYHLKRVRAGGTTQQGNLYGIHLGYDRLKRYGWYWGLEGSYARGKLKGHTGDGDQIRSHFNDSFIEGRLGYTFQQKECTKIAFTPFIGGGYSVEKNNFTSPSPLPIHFKTHYPYMSTGFLSWMHLTDDWEVGLNFKARMAFEPKCHVTHDPDNEPLSQRIGERMQYRVDLPITYRAFCTDHFVITLDPFYENRHYGPHVNYPFDYLKTRITIWGAILELVYRM